MINDESPPMGPLSSSSFSSAQCQHIDKLTHSSVRAIVDHVQQQNVSRVFRTTAENVNKLANSWLV